MTVPRTNIKFFFCWLRSLQVVKMNQQLSIMPAPEHTAIGIARRDRLIRAAGSLSVTSDRFKEHIFWFMTSGGDINHQDEGGNSALTEAVESKRGSAVDTLLKHVSIDVNRKRSDGFSAVFIAILLNNTSLIKKLLLSGKVNTLLTDNSGNTIYHFTLMGNNWATTQAVFYEYENSFYKPERSECNAAGFSVQLLAIMTKHQPTISLVLPRFSDSEEIDGINYRHPLLNNTTLLHEAARFGDARTVAKLIEWGAKLEARNDAFQTPILVAASADHSDIVSMLLKAGARRDVRDRDGAGLAHYAAAIGDFPMLEKAFDTSLSSRLRFGPVCDYNWKMGNKEKHFLHIAAENRQENFLLKVLEKKDDETEYGWPVWGLNPVDTLNQTPFHYCVMYGLQDMATQYINGNPPRRAPISYFHRFNNEGLNPLMLACKHGQVSMAKLLFYGYKMSDNTVSNTPEKLKASDLLPVEYVEEVFGSVIAKERRFRQTAAEVDEFFNKLAQYPIQAAISRNFQQDLLHLLVTSSFSPLQCLLSWPSKEAIKFPQQGAPKSALVLLLLRLLWTNHPSKSL